MSGPNWTIDFDRYVLYVIYVLIVKNWLKLLEYLISTDASEYFSEWITRQRKFDQ